MGKMGGLWPEGLGPASGGLSGGETAGYICSPSAPWNIHVFFWGTRFKNTFRGGVCHPVPGPPRGGGKFCPEKPVCVVEIFGGPPPFFGGRLSAGLCV